MPLDISFQEENMEKSAGILLPFLVLLFVVMGCSEESRKQQREDDEREKRTSVHIAAREAFANKMSEKFELPGSRRCVADFYADGKDSKTLTVRPCSLLTERGEKVDLYKLFEADTMRQVKELGFTTIETERDGKTVYRSVE
jgi:hypothetical protein